MLKSTPRPLFNSKFQLFSSLKFKIRILSSLLIVLLSQFGVNAVKYDSVHSIFKRQNI